MARARNIKPAFFVNEDLTELPYEARLLFIGLWTLADREGRLADRPKRIKIELFPVDNIDIDSMLNKLANAKFIERYESDGKSVISIGKFSKHQSPHGTEKDSELPNINGYYTVNERKFNGVVTGVKKLINNQSTLDNDEITLNNVKSTLDNALNPECGILNPDLLNPDILNVDKESKPKKQSVKNDYFDQFWKLYPRHEAKANAQKAWDKIKPDEILFKTIMDGLSSQIKSKWTDPKYIPHPTTWLNGGRWADEVSGHAENESNQVNDEPFVYKPIEKPYEMEGILSPEDRAKMARETMRKMAGGK